MKLEWFQKPTTIRTQQDDSDSSPHLTKWFTDGTINGCYNALDVHVANGRGDQDALIWDSPVTNSKRIYSYEQLLREVSYFAGVLVDECRIQKGDRVVIYMPMIPQAVVAMLACARIGAIHSVVFGGFASKELATRIDDCAPKAIISASCGVEPNDRVVPYKPLLDEALRMANHDVKQCIIVRRRLDEHDASCDMVQGRDEDYDNLMSKQDRPADAVPLLSTDPHYILYTSGTTGLPKGVLRDTGGHATALKWTMSTFYNTNPGEVFWAASDIGWVVGHSYIVYAPLLAGCTTVLYEGKPVGTPDAGAFWRVVQDYRVKTLFTAPTAFRAMKQVDPRGEYVKKYDIGSLKAVFAAGERCDPDTLKWCEDHLSSNVVSDGNRGNKLPVIDHWWQTELGFPGAGNALGLGHIPPKYGACAAPVCGFDIRVLDHHGSEMPPNQLGELVIKLPLPPGTLPTLYNDDERYVEGYLKSNPGFYTTGDAGSIDEEGYISVMSRTDDIINTAGHRLSTGSMEEILLDHAHVADCAVIGVNDEIKGQVPMGFVVMNKGSTIDEDDLCRELVQRVRDMLGPVASFKKVMVVNGLPKTRSGKILRGTMKKIANGEPYVITPTIEDANIFHTLAPAIEQLVKQQ
eukprot:CAMPEP_0195520902 /NCGR_PEP_ID=MMETSP0794_2-20130614/17606_1 /TAXON_ID=515487 /ORGANISM="Stephanopyxis turris, Strain CCMP 815" /LENGTH=631 /DNA_ID=CAMNT_0040650341 /DNA_START=248 /DNA_END=2143 /DNA_ORIENTATION=+